MADFQNKDGSMKAGKLTISTGSLPRPNWPLIFRDAAIMFEEQASEVDRLRTELDRAADVLAAAEEVEKFHRHHNDPNRTMSDADWRKGMDERIVKLRGFVEAHRKEGRDDG